jgi:serine/threonine protein kinase
VLKSGEMKLQLYPIGWSKKPTDVDQGKQCVSRILVALQSMHKCGFCHRDVRWPNIVQCLDGRWILIDLDCSSWLNKPWPLNLNHQSIKWPDVAENWGARNDVWMVGRLLDGLDIRSDEIERLASEIKQCTSCDEALRVLKS